MTFQTPSEVSTQDLSGLIFPREQSEQAAQLYGLNQGDPSPARRESYQDPSKKTRLESIRSPRSRRQDPRNDLEHVCRYPGGTPTTMPSSPNEVALSDSVQFTRNSPGKIFRQLVELAAPLLLCALRAPSPPQPPAERRFVHTKAVVVSRFALYDMSEKNNQCSRRVSTIVPL